jgi:hypothetical protein
VIRMLVPFTCAELGGSQLMTLRLLKALDRQIFDIEVWLFAEGPYRQRLEAAGIPVHTLPRSLVRFPWNFRKLHRRIAEGRFDVADQCAGQAVGPRRGTSRDRSRPSAAGLGDDAVVHA